MRKIEILCSLQRFKRNIRMTFKSTDWYRVMSSKLCYPDRIRNVRNGFLKSKKVDFYQTHKVDNCLMEDFQQSEQFSFWSHEASQGSCRNTARRTKCARPLKKAQLETRGSQYADTKTSSKNEKKRLAGIRSREKKKNYVGALEERVNQLGSELEEVESEIARCKDSLLEAIKTSNNNSNEHAYTYAELERIASSEDPDLDRINLLIDLVKVRVGANGRERQAKLDYIFKQIVNAMFPASYRYLLNTAASSLDVFAPGATLQSLSSNTNSWISELYQSAGLENRQVEKAATLRQGLSQKRREAIALAVRLRQANEALKRQGQIFQRKLGDFRQDMSAIQCAKMLLFGEKNKLRKQFAICADFQSEPLTRKRVKNQ